MTTLAEIRDAEAYSIRHRRAMVKLIQIDEAAAGNPADVAMCHRVREAALHDFGEFENLMTFPEVQRLFNKGGLHFRRSE